MKRYNLTVVIGLLLVLLVGCTKSINSPEEIGKAHFDMYFNILSEQEVNVSDQCELLYASDFVSYCETTMAEAEDMLELRVLTEDDYELLEVTSEVMDDSLKEMRRLTDYEVVYEVTIRYNISSTNENDDNMIEMDYTMFVVEIDGEYKAVQPNFN